MRKFRSSAGQTGCPIARTHAPAQLLVRLTPNASYAAHAKDTLAARALNWNQFMSLLSVDTADIDRQPLPTAHSAARKTVAVFIIPGLQELIARLRQSTRNV